MQQHSMIDARPDRRKISKWLSAMIVVMTVALLLPLLYVGVYNHPSPLDDYDYAEWGSYPDMQRELYMGWSGRYFCNLALTLCPLHWHSFTAYRTVVIMLIALFMVAIAAVVRRGLISYTAAPGHVCTALAAGTVLLILNSMPSLVEGFFWYSSAVTHVISAILLAVLLCIFIRVDVQKELRPATGIYMCSILLIIAIIGCNEVSLVLCDVLCVLLWLYYRQQAKPGPQHFYTWLCIVCLVCSLVSLCAPGNAHRQSVTGRSLWMVLPTWLYFTQKLAFKWLLDPFLLLYSAGFLLLVKGEGIIRPVTNLLVAFFIPIAILFVLCLPPHYALGIAPPRRVLNVVYIFFVLGWIFFLLHLAAHMQPLWDILGNAGIVIKSLAGIVVGLCLVAGFSRFDFTQANVYMVIRGLARGIPQAYNAELNRRYGLIKAAARDTVGVPSIKTVEGNILYFVDIGENCARGTNQFYGRYWGKACVYVY